MTTAAYYTGNKKFEIRAGGINKPGRNKVAVRVAYCGICGTDRHIFHGLMDSRVKPPQILGHEMSGTVIETGEGVTAYKPGDLVAVRPLDWCGTCPTCLKGHTHICQTLNVIGVDSEGGFQSVLQVSERTLHRTTPGIDLKRAALAEPLAVACHDVRMGSVSKGDYCVVIGGGPIGLLIALVCRHFGGNTLLLELNDRRASFAQKMGVRTVNPQESNVKDLVLAETKGAGADVVFEVSASSNGAELMTDLACPRGRIVLVGVFSDPAPVTLKQMFLKELRLFGARLYEARDFDDALRHIADGSISVEPFISEIYPLRKIGDAFESLDRSLDAMKILIDCGSSSD